MASPPGTRFEDVRERVRAASDISEVIGQHVSLRKVGRSWKGLCPFHQEKTPSFTVSPERQTYHCFGCGVGGDVFGFVEEMEKVSFAEALRVLADRAGIDLPRWRSEGEGSARLYEICQEAAVLYRRWLRDAERGRKARDLLRARGIQKGVEDRFEIGYAPPGWDSLSNRLERRFGRETLIQAGLAIQRDRSTGIYDRFRDRLVVPLRTPSGRVLGFGGRVVGEGEPKYLNSPETPVYRKGHFLFGLGEARQSLREGARALLVEGYFDVLALHQAGIESVVAVGGTAVTKEQARLLARFTDRVCVALDGDPAGQTATRKSLAPLLGAGLDVRVAVLPAQDDPDSFVGREGSEALLEVQDKAMTPASYLCHGADLDAAGRKQALSATISLAAALDDLPQREAFLLETDRLLSVGLERLRGEVERRRQGARETSDTRGIVAPASDPVRVRDDRPVPFLERSLLALVCTSTEAARQAAKKIPADWLEHPDAREAWRALQADPGGDSVRWMSAVGPGAKVLFAASVEDAPQGEDPRRTLDDHLRRLEARRLRAEREDVRHRLASPGSAKRNQEELKRLQEIATRLHALGGGSERILKGDAE